MTPVFVNGHGGVAVWRCGRVVCVCMPLRRISVRYRSRATYYYRIFILFLPLFRFDFHAAAMLLNQI